MITCYSLLEIHISNETLLARPVAWDVEDADGFGNDMNGNPINAVGWHTTCPSCGNLVEFGKEDIYVGRDGSEHNVKCCTCDSGKKFKKTQHLTPGSPETATYVDPITAGLFTVGYDLEVLEQLDEKLN